MAGDYARAREFYDTVVRPIPGWLEDYTAIVTIEMMRFQERREIRGSLLEIGVFGGKYFSILLASAMRDGSRIIGIDTFEYISLAAARQNLRLADDAGDQVQFIASRSSDIAAGPLLAQLGGAARFISIDGSHERVDVYLDLTLADQLLDRLGIIAVDDFLNPLTFGVNEAVNTYFSMPRNLRPWAYIANKLLLCRPSAAPMYREWLEASVMADPTEDRSRRFQSHANERGQIECTLFGCPVLLLP